MRDKTIEVKNDINEIANYYCDLFVGYSKLSSAQKDAVKDWSKRCFLGNGIFRFAYAQYISSEAKKILESLPIDELDLEGWQMEHIVPKSNYGLAKIFELAEKNPSDEELKTKIPEIVKKEMLVCFVTKEQNKRLSEVSKDNMTEEFSEEKQNYFVRYEKAFGMKEDELMKDFFVKIESIQIKDNKIIING